MDEVTAPAIPIIDLGAFLRGEPGALQETAGELAAALRDIGFFLIVNHGVPQALIDRIFAEAARFHAQPMAAKEAVRMNAHSNGYLASASYTIRTSEVADNDTPDLNEAFFIKRERGADDPLARAGWRFTGPNEWPDGLPGFRETARAYIDTMDALARRLLPVVATALELPPEYFDGLFDRSHYALRLSHYPPVAAAAADQYGIAPHTDANFMTFLAQTAVPGLQVRMPSGAWQDVPYIAGSFAVNSGDMLHRWSNGRLKSTPHRALPPTRGARYAVPFFMAPNLDAVIECLPTCQGPDNPPRHPPISYHDYMSWWYDTNYNTGEQDAAAS